MDRTITVTYSEDVIRYTARKFWARNIGLTGFVAFFIIVVAFVYLLLSGDRSWFIGVMGTAVLISFGLGTYSYFIYLKQSFDKFKLMKPPTAKVHFSEEQITIQSNLGLSELPWALLEKIWKYPDVWLIFVAKQNFFTLPTHDLDEEIRKFITQKVIENGGKAE